MNAGDVIWLGGFLVSWPWLSILWDRDSERNPAGLSALMGFACALIWPLTVPPAAMVQWLNWRRRVRARPVPKPLAFDAFSRHFTPKKRVDP